MGIRSPIGCGYKQKSLLPFHQFRTTYMYTSVHLHVPPTMDNRAACSAIHVPTDHIQWCRCSTVSTMHTSTTLPHLQRLHTNTTLPHLQGGTCLSSSHHPAEPWPCGGGTCSASCSLPVPGTAPARRPPPALHPPPAQEYARHCRKGGRKREAGKEESKKVRRGRECTLDITSVVKGCSEGRPS